MFPEELFIKILDYLDTRYYHQIYLTNRTFKNIISDIAFKKYGFDITLIIKEKVLIFTFLEKMNKHIKDFKGLQRFISDEPFFKINKYKQGNNTFHSYIVRKNIFAINKADHYTFYGTLNKDEMYHIVDKTKNEWYLVCTNIKSKISKILFKMSINMTPKCINISLINNTLVLISMFKHFIVFDFFCLLTKETSNNIVGHYHSHVVNINLLTNKNGDIIVNHRKSRENSFFGSYKLMTMMTHFKNCKNEIEYKKQYIHQSCEDQL